MFGIDKYAVFFCIFRLRLLLRLIIPSSVVVFLSISASFRFLVLAIPLGNRVEKNSQVSANCNVNFSKKKGANFWIFVAYYHCLDCLLPPHMPVIVQPLLSSKACKLTCWRLASANCCRGQPLERAARFLRSTQPHLPASQIPQPQMPITNYGSPSYRFTSCCLN